MKTIYVDEQFTTIVDSWLQRQAKLCPTLDWDQDWEDAEDLPDQKGEEDADHEETPKS